MAGSKTEHNTEQQVSKRSQLNGEPTQYQPSKEFNGYVHWNGGYTCTGLRKDQVVGMLKTATGPDGDSMVLGVPLQCERERFLNSSGSDAQIECCGPPEIKEDEYPHGSWRAHVTLLLLLMANLLNYMDRYTIAGVLNMIQDYFQINNASAGLLQTSFICSYMVLSPIFGYLGDRYSRKLIMGLGILFWSAVTLAGSFVGPDQFYLFLFLRGLVGVGEASYSTIAPTIIADLFVKNQRTIALAIFYFAIPVGSGMGYIVGASVAQAFGHWAWALRVTPPLGIVCCLLIMFVVREPTRGGAEGGSHIQQTSWSADVIYLCKNKSFVLSSCGFTMVAFVAGALSLWAPKFMDYSIRVQGNIEDEAKVSLNFGIITCLAGIMGVFIGTFVAGQLRRSNPRADPLVCAAGLILCSPFLFLALYASQFSTLATWILIFLGEVFLCLNWALVTDIVLYVVIPTRRSTAEAGQILFSHLLGDAGSPYLVGVMTDHIAGNLAAGENTYGEVAQQFIALQYSLYMCCFACVLGGGFFLATALFIVKDRTLTENAIKQGLADANVLAVESESCSPTNPAGSIA